MRWSKLRQRIEARFAPEIGVRVKVHVTGYHRAHDREGELFVTLDRTKVYGTSLWHYYAEKFGNAFNSPEFKNWKPIEENDDSLLAQGIWCQHEVMADIFQSLSQTVDEMLVSPHPLIRALAVLDTRCGQRRLAKLDLANEHELVVRFCALRTEDRGGSSDRFSDSRTAGGEPAVR